MEIQLSVPSKTFIVGEYLALLGGKALLASTEPRFVLKVSSDREGSCEGIHSWSPGGKLLRSRSDLFSHWRIEFYDPWHGAGGFGASSAQFVLVYALKSLLEGGFGRSNSGCAEMVKEFLSVSWDGQGWTPSGSDLVSQFNGYLTLTGTGEPQRVWTHWPFSDLGFVLVHTNRKVVTHKHLETLKEFPGDELKEILDSVERAVVEKDAKKFVFWVEAYGSLLAKHQLVDPFSREMIEKVKRVNGVLGAKGCGALGADVLLILTTPETKSSVAEWAQANGLRFCGGDTLLSEGLRLEVQFGASPEHSHIFESGTATHPI